MSLQEYISQGVDVRFFRVYLKVLDRSGRPYDAIFLIQTLLLEFSGTDECFYYSKQCLKLCKKWGADIPNAFWRSFGQFYLRSKTLCELLIDLYRQSPQSFGSNVDTLKDNVVEVLSCMPGTRKIWLFMEDILAKSHRSAMAARINLPALIRFHLNTILGSLSSRRADAHNVFVLKRLSKLATTFALPQEKIIVDRLSVFLKGRLDA